MGKTRGRRPVARPPFEPRGYEPFNIIVSLQYKGLKEKQFSDLAFSTKEGVKRAMNTLQLSENLITLKIPHIVSLDRVFRSSFGYPNTIEVFYPNCEGRGVCLPELQVRSIR